jgi:amidase
LQIDAPFCGVPFLLKDTHHALKGFPMSSGSELLKDYIPEHDAEIVKRFMKAGLVIIGKTHNPWNLTYTPVGSSGGSAAAVAARIVPFASATDEGRSIRVPASCCGLFGLKPSRGRNPVRPDFDGEWDGMSTSHVITRSVRDFAAVMDAISGIEPGAPYSINSPERPFFEGNTNKSGKNEDRISYTVSLWEGGAPRMYQSGRARL